jgi:hypothetical protein
MVRSESEESDAQTLRMHDIHVYITVVIMFIKSYI